jgi:RNA polymerase sigma factor (sigma-70 family)
MTTLDARLEDLLRNNASVSRLVTALCRDPHDAADLLNDARQKARNRVEVRGQPVPPDEQIARWFGGILRRVAWGHRRTAIRRRARELAAARPDAQAADSSPLLMAQREENRTKLTRALDRLEPRQRDLLVAQYFDDLTIAEIAQRIRRSESLVKQNLKAAREALRKQLDVEYGGDRANWVAAFLPVSGAAATGGAATVEAAAPVAKVATMGRATSKASIAWSVVFVVSAAGGVSGWIESNGRSQARSGIVPPSEARPSIHLPSVGVSGPVGAPAPSASPRRALPKLIQPEVPSDDVFTAAHAVPPPPRALPSIEVSEIVVDPAELSGAVASESVKSSEQRWALRAFVVGCLNARRAVAHNCSMCEASGKIHRAVTGTRGSRSIEVTCSTCYGAGLIFVQTKADEVKACFWRGSRYPAALWGRGSSGRGVGHDRRPPAASRVIALAENAGWLTDTTNVDKIGEINETEGVLWGEATLQSGDSTPGSFHCVRFPEGWKIVAPDEIDDAVNAALGRPSAKRAAQDLLARSGVPIEAATAPRRGGVARLAEVDGPGRWRVENGVLIGFDAEQDFRSTAIRFGDPRWTKYVMTLNAMSRIPKGSQLGNGFAVHLHCGANWGDCVGANYGYMGNAYATLSGSAPLGARHPILRQQKRSVTFDQWYALRLVVDGPQVELLVNGQSVYKHPAVGKSAGLVGFACNVAEFHAKDIRIEGFDAAVLWEGPPELPRQ